MKSSLIILLSAGFAVSCAWSADSAPQVSETNLYQSLVSKRDPAAALSLARRGAAAVPLLRQALQRPDRVGALTAWAVAQHPHPELAPALRGRLLHVDQVAGYYAARALGRLPSPENAAALASLLASETNGYWEISSGGSGKLRDAWTDKGERYNERAPTNMPNLRVAYAAMEALGEMGGDAAAATLLRALKSDQYLIRYGAARGLGRLRHVPAREALASLSQVDPVLLVRRAAAVAAAAVSGELPGNVNVTTLSPAAEPALLGDEQLSLPPSIIFLKTKHRSDATFGFRDSYFFPKTPRYHSGDNLYSLTPPAPGGVLKNLTQLSNGEVQGAEISPDGARILFSMRRNKDRDGFHIFEMNVDGSSLRQITDGNCNDVDPCYVGEGRIAFSSDRCGWQEYYHQERSRVLYVVNSDGTGLQQITFNPNEDYEPVALRNGRLLYSSYRFYAQDGSEGPLPGEYMGLARIETVLRGCNPDGSGDDLFYGSMRGPFYVPMRPMPFSDQFAGWHGRGYHVGVSVSLQREMPDGRVICATPAGLTVIDTTRAPLDCELPIYPEIVNLAGGEEVYIHNYDDMNPVGRYTSPHPLGGNWVLVSHAPWHDLRPNAYALYALNVATRELKLLYDDPEMADVDPLPVLPQSMPARHDSHLATKSATGRVFCNSVFNTDQPYDTNAVRYVRVLEGVQMGQSISANASFRTRDLGVSPIHPDGSFFAEVPADVPIRFQLLDGDGRMLIHETEFLFVRPGETKGCAGCHENRKEASRGGRPMALKYPPFQATRQRGDLIYFGRRDRSYNHVYRD